jgi:branched-chain amino acid transport system permease protein
LAELNLALLFLLDLAAVFAVYLTVTLGLNMEYGFTGIPNFGKALAFAAGAFSVAYFPGRLLSTVYGLDRGIDAYANNQILASCIRDYASYNPGVLRGVNYIADNVVVTTCLTKVLQNDPLLSISIVMVTVLFASSVGALLGFIASYPAIRLRQDYLAMTLLAMAEAANIIGYNYPEIAGGTLGVAIPDPYAWVGPGQRFVLATLLLVIMAVVTYVYLWRVSSSPFGRIMKAVRDGELAAESLGKDVVKVRQKVLVVSSAIAAAGGALWAFYAGGVIALTYDRVSWTFWPWVMVIMGGAANNFGVLLGTGIFVTSRKLIDYYKYSLGSFLPFNVVWLDRLGLGIVLLIMLIARPQGILAEKPQMPLKKEKILAIIERVKRHPNQMNTKQ